LSPGLFVELDITDLMDSSSPPEDQLQNSCLQFSSTRGGRVWLTELVAAGASLAAGAEQMKGLVLLMIPTSMISLDHISLVQR